MPGAEPDADGLLAIAAKPNRDGLRLALQPLLPYKFVFAQAMDGLEGGPPVPRLCLAIIETGRLPSNDELWAHREFFELDHYDHEHPRWRCFAAWVLLVWATDPDCPGEYGAHSVLCLVQASLALSTEHTARAIAFLTWQREARPYRFPRVYHELGITCLFAELANAVPSPSLIRALELQCQRTETIADRDVAEYLGDDDAHEEEVRWPFVDNPLDQNAWRRQIAESVGGSESQAAQRLAARVANPKTD